MEKYKTLKDKPNITRHTDVEGLIIRGGGRYFSLKLSKERRAFIFQALLMVVICILHALPAGHYADFYPINGTFQNFNPIRRLLSGQIPYSDFTDYLGLGHLYTGSIITAIIGGDYQGSLIAFSFLTFFAVGITSYVIGKSVLKGEGVTALCITNLLLLMLLIQPLFFINSSAMTVEIKEALNYALGTGNSARFVRGLILPIVISFFYLCCGIEWKHKRLISQSLSGYIGDIGIGVLAGFSFCWSNDYGISSWLCLAIMLFIVRFSQNRKFRYALLHLLIEVTTSFASLFFFVELLTWGNFAEWFQSIFGTGGYQRWYYNSSKSHYLYDVDFSFIMLLQAMIAIVYLWFVFKERGSMAAVKRYGIPAFANITAFCAVNEYRILSGEDSREVALTVLFLTVFFEVSNFLWEYSNKRIKLGLTILSVTIGIAWVGSTLKDELIFAFATEKNGSYNEALGGYVTARNEDMELATKFLNGKNFWATYASGQEVVEKKFQPSGVDYIIHVLGDRQRNNYMQKFNAGGFQYVSTIQKEFTDWEYWVERANWFFYRELYQNWHPVFANQYQVYWEKNQDNDNTITDGISLEIVNEGESKVRLIVRTVEPIDGIADVFIDYNVRKKKNALSPLMIQSVLLVKNTGLISASNDFYESNYLRNKSSEYIPIPVINGYGETLLTASPERSASLELKYAECKAIYTSMLKNLQTMSLTDNNWDNGVHRNGNILLLAYDAAVLSRLKKAESIGTFETQFPIEKVEYDGEFIRVHVDGEASICQYPSMLSLGGLFYGR